MATEVKFVPEAERYEITVDGEVAGHVDARERDGIIEMPHTIIGDEFGGRGLAKTLVQYALNDLREKGRKIEPICPFVQGFIEKNPEYAGMVA